MNGFLNIHKPRGITSHDVVARVRRITGKGIRVGHAGTLDPAASGVLPVGLGQATRLIEYLADASKAYRGLVRLGVTTTTDDGEGEILETRPVPPMNVELIERAVAPLRGDIMQVPPIYSALHHQGRRLYDLARAGQIVEPPPRPVTVSRLDWQIIDAQTLEIEVECSKGTYIRSLARDIGSNLGCGGHLIALDRTRVGPFRIAESVSLEILSNDLSAYLLPMETALEGWPELWLDAEQTRRVQHGMTLRLAEIDGTRLRAHAPNGTLVALLRREGDIWKPEKVLVSG